MYWSIEDSTEQNDSGIFVEFMLGAILNALKNHLQNDTVNDTANDTVNMILNLARSDPSVSYEELARKTGKSHATVSRSILELKKSGRIKRCGADKNGWWEVTEQ